MSTCTQGSHAKATTRASKRVFVECSTAAAQRELVTDAANGCVMVFGVIGIPVRDSTTHYKTVVVGRRRELVA